MAVTFSSVEIIEITEVNGLKMNSRQYFRGLRLYLVLRRYPHQSV